MSDYVRKYQLIRDIYSDPESIGKDVTVCGHIFAVRLAAKSTIAFISLVDGSTARHLQCVYTKDGTKDEELFKHLHKGACLRLSGTIVECPESAKGQLFELQVKSYECYGSVESESYPLAGKGEIHMDTLRQLPHLRGRTKTFMAVEVIKKRTYSAIHEYMKKIGFGEIAPTETTENECEAASCPFVVTTLIDKDVKTIPVKEGTTTIDYDKDFYRKRVFLTVSAQLHLEATVCATGDGYCMTIAFRAEPSTGPRHLSEFCMPEYEFRFGTLDDNMQICEGLLKYCITCVLKDCAYELEFLQESTPDLITGLRRYVSEPFVRTTHQECVRRMLEDKAAGKVTFEIDPAYEDDLTKEHERYITEKMYGGLPVFVKYFPKKIKAFYMPVIDKGEEVEHVNGFDLLFPLIGEVVGGSQRIWKHDELVQRMDEMGVSKEPLQWYLDLRKHGGMPHGGAGIGFGRLIMVLTGLQIKDTQEFSRSYQSCLF